MGANVYNPERKLKTELINDHFQNYKRYHIPKAQLVIADIPYNLGNNAYASSLEWYVDGDNKKGESDKANKAFFDTDNDFRISEFMHFCSKMLIKEPKDKGKAPAMIVFCAFQQMQMVIDYGKKYGFNNSYPLVFIKPSSAQVLKANMKIVGATEYAVVLYRDKLPKFNNGAQKDAEGKTIRGTGKMIKNWFEWKQDDKKVYPKIHPTQKPVNLLKQLIEIFTDEGEVVIDPCAGSASTLRAAAELNRNSFGFEIKKDMYLKANAEMLSNIPAPMVQECLTI
ncbi:DNA-methyltransferase [Culicoidibacter larvae]|uniref:DNA-methyltransferase n=1 Tax=Culicoidibacter larvae TaxID=2579976 RepID=UPI001F54C755|nr:site-specific DNA-methyltransferase [Culicoidibacter larvae]